MKYTKLGNSDLNVSKICVGGMSFGKPSADFHEWTLGEKETENMVQHALDLGINFFDTANSYSHGTSEEYLGRALKKTQSVVMLLLQQKFILMMANWVKWLLNAKLICP